MKPKLENQLCAWKDITNNTNVHYMEGRLRHCQLYCDGYQFGCDTYESVKVFDKEDNIIVGED